jgi:hypothetical protein
LEKADQWDRCLGPLKMKDRCGQAAEGDHAQDRRKEYIEGKKI